MTSNIDKLHSSQLSDAWGSGGIVYRFVNFCRAWWVFTPPPEVRYDWRKVYDTVEIYSAILHSPRNAPPDPADEARLISARTLLLRARLATDGLMGFSLVNLADLSSASVSFSQLERHFSRYQSWEQDLDQSLMSYHPTKAKQKKDKRDELFRKWSDSKDTIVRRTLGMELLEAHANDWHLVNNREYYTICQARRIGRALALSLFASAMVITRLFASPTTQANTLAFWEPWYWIVFGTLGASLSILVKSKSKTTSAVTFRRGLAEIALRLNLGATAGLFLFMVLFTMRSGAVSTVSSVTQMYGYLFAFASGFSEKLFLNRVMEIVNKGGENSNRDVEPDTTD
jgi:hypothetical protein